MFEIGFTELLLIAVVALVVLGPKRLPTVARTAGHLIGRFQRYANQVKSDISREMQLDELRAMQAEVQKTAADIEQTIRTEVDDIEMRAKAQAAELEQVTQEATQAASHTVERVITQEARHEVQHVVAPAASARELAAAADAAESQFDEIQAAISRVMESAPPGVLNPAPAVALTAPAAPAPAAPATPVSKPLAPEAAPTLAATDSPAAPHTTPAPAPVDHNQLALFADPPALSSKPTR